MFNGQSFTVGLNLPPISLGCPDSNRKVQIVYSQGPTDSQKAQQMLHIQKQDMTDLDSSSSVCNISPSGAVMTSADSGLPDNLQDSAGLMRYHSAPGSFIASLAENGNDIVCQVSGPGPDNVLAQILSCDSSLTSESNSRALKHNDSPRSSNRKPEKHMEKHNEYSRMTALNPSHLKRSSENVAGEDLGKQNHLPAILENGLEVSQDSFCSSQMSMMCQEQGPQSSEQLLDNSFKQNSVLYSPHNSTCERMASFPPTATKSTLVRHSSSPAGVLSRMNAETQCVSVNGYPDGLMKSNMSMGNLLAENSSRSNAVAPNRLDHQMNFLRQSSSPAGLLAQLSMDMDIPEIVDKLNMHMGRSSGGCLARCSSDSGQLGNAGGGQGYISNLSVGSWEDGLMLPGNYEAMQNGTNIAARKRVRDMDEKMMPGLNLPDKLKGEAGSHAASALPNNQFGFFKATSSEMAMEKLLEDSVPCRIRAKRGCATHPRSIAERVRRTRISDRMRKLQELVPNMDKQTNTADMLDEAVEYVKFLQKQVQELSENRGKCDCSCGHNSDAINKT
eukprot:Gb_37017 [translate_table: standard]